MGRFTLQVRHLYKPEPYRPDLNSNHAMPRGTVIPWLQGPYWCGWEGRHRRSLCLARGAGRVCTLGCSRVTTPSDGSHPTVLPTLGCNPCWRRARLQAPFLRGALHGRARPFSCLSAYCPQHSHHKTRPVSLRWWLLSTRASGPKRCRIARSNSCSSCSSSSCRGALAGHWLAQSQS